MKVHDVDGLNVGYAHGLLEQYLENPEAVPGNGARSSRAATPTFCSRSRASRGCSRRCADENGAPAPARRSRLRPLPRRSPRPSPTPAPPATCAEPLDQKLLTGVAAAASLVKAYRTHGHLAAQLDPLGSEPVGDPALEPERLVPKLTPELQAHVPAAVLRVGCEGETLADILPAAAEIYCGTIAYEIEHISDHQERVWLRQAIETGRYRRRSRPTRSRRLLERLTEVEVFEHYLRRAFLGQKQFSIEGLDVLVPMLDESLSSQPRPARTRS